jgi:hypothetical protein
MSIGGVSITSSGTSDLPYDISEISLQQAIRDSKIVGFENVLVALENQQSVASTPAPGTPQTCLIQL